MKEIKNNNEQKGKKMGKKKRYVDKKQNEKQTGPIEVAS